jgi:hypothetical protein
MKLYYKELLINEISIAARCSDLFANYWYNRKDKYLNDLGLPPSLYALHRIDDSEYCGQCLEKDLPEGNYYILKDGVDYFWFVTPEDALYFAKQYNPTDLSISEHPQNSNYYENLFNKRRRKVVGGFLWLTSEDIEEVESIEQCPPILYCVEADREWLSVDEAAEWLVASGKAANAITAKRQLEKYFRGSISRCYGFTWRWQ